MEAQKRKLSDWTQLFLKGIAMGAADVVPGVSGGTIAFISGIYEELIDTLSSFNFGLVGILRKNGIKGFWKAINGSFLLVLFGGIIFSVFALAKGISWLLENEPVRLWAFFFGLVLASIWLMGKQIEKWSISAVLAVLLGAAFAYFVTELPPISPEKTWWFILLSGFIAICAMILPGISGSFILLILGSYKMVIESIKNFEIVDLGIFAVGCLAGLLTFSKALKWMFREHKRTTIAILTGFLIGSLNKLWPWKENGELLYTHSDGRQEFLQSNILPSSLNNPDYTWVITCVTVGALIILGLEFFSSKKQVAKHA